MISRARSGSRNSPRGWKPDITGLRSKTGVPSMASSPSTSSLGPATATTRQTVIPIRFGRFLAALGEDADFQPVLAPPGMSRAGDDLVIAHPVEHIGHLDVREGLES